MNIISWNCHNLNSSVTTGERKNRMDYLELVTKQLPRWDAVFLMETESAFAENVLGEKTSSHFFLPCTELDKAWTPMTSGIFLCTAKHITVLKSELLLPGKELPAKNGYGMDSEYGFALRTLLKNFSSGEMLDLVTIWNTRRKTAPAHGYPSMMNLLLKKLGSDGFFDSATPSMIIGDFNLTAEDIDGQLPPNRDLEVYVRENTHFSNLDPDSAEKGCDLDHVICKSGTLRFFQPDGTPTETFSASISSQKRYEFVRPGVSDHLPLFVQHKAK